MSNLGVTVTFRRQLTLLSLFMVFPFLFLYNATYVYFGVGGFLGGGGAASTLAAFLCLLFYAFFSLSSRYRFGIKCFIFQAIFILFVTVVLVRICFAFFVEMANLEYLSEYFYLILLWVTLFYVGYLSNINIGFSEKYIWIICLVFFLIFILAAHDPSMDRISYRLAAKSYVTHHLYSITTIGTIWLLMRTISSPSKIFLVIFSSLVLVYAIGTRGDFFAIIFSTLVLLGLSMVNHLGYLKISVALSFVLTGFLFLCLLFLFDGIFLLKAYSFSDRFVEVITGESSSGSLRSKFSSEAWKDILERPLMGNTGGQLENNGEFGEYAHNIMSLWRQFGLIPFCLYIIMSLLSLFIIFRSYFRGDTKSPANLWFSVILLFLALFIKPVFWPYPIMIWGIALSVLTNDQREIMLSLRGSSNGNTGNSCK